MSFTDTSVSSNELISSLFVAFHGGSSRVPATRLILNIHFPFFEMFHPSPNTAGAHADISIGTLKSEVNFSSRFFLFNKKFDDSMLSKRNIAVRHFRNCSCSHVTAANNITISKTCRVQSIDYKSVVVSLHY